MVKPAVVNGSETWAKAEMGMKRLGTWERKIIRRMHGPVIEQGIWGVRTNKELRELYKHVDIIADVKHEEIGKDWTRSKNGSGKDN
jgi:hypothetical protein